MKKKSYRFAVLITLIAVGILGFTVSLGWSMDENRHQNISVDQFITMMEKKDLVLINVHIPYQGEIPKTDLLIPFNAIDKQKSALPEAKDKKIVVYCMGGYMGDVASKELVKMGYTNVFNFQGGMAAWINKGKSLSFRNK
jgi:rhodanese-related sulfurtransferase